MTEPLDLDPINATSDIEDLLAEVARLRAVVASPLPLETVTRLEVIDETGRCYTRWHCSLKFSYQDQGRTLKIFVDEAPRPPGASCASEAPK